MSMLKIIFESESHLKCFAVASSDALQSAVVGSILMPGSLGIKITPYGENIYLITYLDRISLRSSARLGQRGCTAKKSSRRINLR